MRSPEVPSLIDVVSNAVTGEVLSIGDTKALMKSLFDLDDALTQTIDVVVADGAAVFGPTRRQVVVLRTKDGEIISSGDHRMVAGEQALWLMEMARLRGWL